MSVYSWRTQYFPPKPAFTEKDVPSQAGRVLLVTGGSRGIGFELCKMLYATGATVYMTARSEDRAREAGNQITGQSPAPATPGSLRTLQLDLADLNSIRGFAARFQASEARLDVLWNNAGTGALAVPAGGETAQGIEAFMGMHCVGALLLTQLLLPLLRAAAAQSAAAGPAPRVVWTCSHLSDRFAPAGGMDLEILGKGGNGDQMLDYASSKAGNWLLSHEHSVRHPEIISVCQNPGNLDTDAFRGLPKVVRRALAYTVLYDSKYGAYTELFAGLSPAVGKEQNGGYIVPWGRIWSEDSNVRKDVLQALKKKEDGGDEVGRRFWEWCEEQWKGRL